MIEDALNVLRQNVVNIDWIKSFTIHKKYISILYTRKDGIDASEPFTDHIKILEWIEGQEEFRK